MNELLRRMLFLPPQASTFSVQVDHLHYFVVTAQNVVGALLALLTLVFCWRYRERQKNQSTPIINPTLGVEIAFIGVPLAVFLLWFAIGFNSFVKQSDPPQDAMDIYVTAKQWMWKFAYPSGPNSVGVLHVPVNRPVRLLLTSRDVIHSFFVPAFRVKKDVLPDRYTETWFQATKTGHFQVLCTEYCGANHSRMWAEVVVMPQAEFDTWLKDQQRGLKARQDIAVAAGMEPPAADMVSEGRRIAAEKGCLRCHTVAPAPALAGGETLEHIGPSWVDLYQRRTHLTNGQTIIADEAYLTESMMDPLAKVVQGYKPVMPTYQGKLTGPEAAAIVEYIKSLRSNRVETSPLQGPVYAPLSNH